MTYDRVPKYRTFVDWYGHGGLASGLANWHYDASNPPAELELSQAQYIRDKQSLHIVDGKLFRPFKGIPDVTLEVSVWVFVPDVPLAPQVELTLRTPDGSTASSTAVSTLHGAWEKLTVDTSTTDEEELVIFLSTSAESGHSWYLGWSEVRSPLDDISSDVLSTRQVPEIVYGRDAAQDLAETRTGEVSVSLRNETGKYTPGNPASPVVEFLNPNRQVVITAELDDVIYTLYVGYTQDFQIQAKVSDQSVSISCYDLFGKLATTEVHTDLLPSVRTGDAIRAILEASAIYQKLRPAYEDSIFGDATVFDPFIDSGCSVLRWWTYAGDAFGGIQDIVRSEGPPSLISVGTSGQVVFRDRGHRFRPTYSVPEIVLTDECLSVGNHVALDEDSSVDYGWATVANVVTGTYGHRVVSGEYSDVWTHTGDVTFGDTSTSGTTYTFEGTVDGGYYDAQDLVGGTLQRIENQGASQTDVWSGILPEEHDYVVVTGDVSTYLHIRQGSKVSIEFTDKVASTGMSTVRDVRLRAKSVNETGTPITQRIQGSIDAYGAEKTMDIDLGPVTQADAASIVDRILAKDAYRRPTVVAILRNRTAQDMKHMLEMDLGQLVTVRVGVWAIDALFTVEAIEHSLAENGADHTTTLHLQQINPIVTGNGIFTFDDPDLGFDVGVYGSAQPADQVTLVLPGTIGSYAYTDGISETSYLDVRAQISPSVWANGTVRTIVAQWDDDGEEPFAWRFVIDGDGLLRWDVNASNSGSAPSFVFDDPGAGFDVGTFHGYPTVFTHTAPAPTPQADVEYVRAVWQGDNGSDERTVEFFYGPSIDGPWDSVGDVTVTPDVIITPTAGRLTVGSSASGLDDGSAAADEFVGTLGQVQILDVDDNVMVNPIFREQEIGITVFEDSESNTWRLLNGARIAGDGPMFIIGQSPLDSDKLLSY